MSQKAVYGDRMLSFANAAIKGGAIVGGVRAQCRILRRRLILNIFHAASIESLLRSSQTGLTQATKANSLSRHGGRIQSFPPTRTRPGFPEFSLIDNPPPAYTDEIAERNLSETYGCAADIIVGTLYWSKSEVQTDQELTMN